MDIPTVEYLIKQESDNIARQEREQIIMSFSLAATVGSYQMDSKAFEWADADRVLVAIDKFAKGLRGVMDVRRKSIAKSRAVINQLEAEKQKLEAQIYLLAKSDWTKRVEGELPNTPDQ